MIHFSAGTLTDFPLVQWVLDITPKDKFDVDVISLRLLHILVAAVHTSSVTYLNALYDLALHPEVQDELRHEIVTMFAEEQGNWKKQGLTKLVKMDSFVKESARFHPFQAGRCFLVSCDDANSTIGTIFANLRSTSRIGTMDRIAVRDYTLGDGTFVPKGTYMLIPSSASNFDKDVWGPDADKFDPWRFQKMRLVPGQESQHSLVQTSPKFTYFG